MLRFLLYALFIPALALAPRGLSAQIFYMPYRFAPSWTSGAAAIRVHLHPRAARELREMYLRSANERREHAACLYGRVEEVAGVTFATVQHADDVTNIVGVEADSVSVRLNGRPLCRPRRHLRAVGRAHTHINVSTGFSRVNFSDVDEISYIIGKYTLDLLVWEVTRSMELKMTWHVGGAKGFITFPTRHLPMDGGRDEKR